MAAGVFVIDGHGDVNLDAAKHVDDFVEAVEVDFRVMRDAHARQLGNRLHGQRRAAEHVRGVQLVHAVFAHVNHGIAMQRHQRDLLAHRVDARKHDAVRAVTVAEIAGLVALGRAVGAHEQHIERLFRHVRFHEVLPHVAQAGMQIPGKHLHVRERCARADEHDGKRCDAGVEQLAVLFVLVGFRVFVARKALRRGVVCGGLAGSRALRGVCGLRAVAAARVAVLRANFGSRCATSGRGLVCCCAARALTVAPVACAFVFHRAILTAPEPGASQPTSSAGNDHRNAKCPKPEGAPPQKPVARLRRFLFGEELSLFPTKSVPKGYPPDKRPVPLS